jgi:hypothetical protein
MMEGGDEKKKARARYQEKQSELEGILKLNRKELI